MMWCRKFILLSVLFVLRWALPAQEFQSLYSDLDELDLILERQQKYIDSQTRTLSDLQQKINLSESEVNALRDISLTQGELLNNLQQKIQLQEQIRQEQLRYQKTLGRELLIWKVGGIVFGVTSAGLLIWGLLR